MRSLARDHGKGARGFYYDRRIISTLGHQLYLALSRGIPAVVRNVVLDVEVPSVKLVGDATSQAKRLAGELHNNSRDGLDPYLFCHCSGAVLSRRPLLAVALFKLEPGLVIGP